MPRFLWLGLVVCAAGLIAAFLFVRTLDTKSLAEPESTASAVAPPKDALDLARAEPMEDSERESIGVAQTAETSPATDRSKPTRLGHTPNVGRGYVDPHAFDAGVIEVRVVRDHDGHPMAGVNVALSRDEDPDVQITDSGGTVIFTNVEKGQASVSAMLAGHARASEQAWIDRESPHQNVELRLVVERELVVRLRDPNGRTFEPAAWQLDRRAADRIGIRLDSRCGRLGSAFEAVDVLRYASRSAEKELGPFTWRVRIQRTPEVCIHALLDDVIVGVERLDPLASELDVRLDPAALEAALTPAFVRVLVQGSDAPISGALIEFEGSFSANSKPPSFQSQVDGRASVSLAAAPSTQMVVSARGYARASLTLTRPFPREFIVRMSPARRIAGRVFDRDGSPVYGARMELRTLGHGSSAAQPSVVSRKNGHFEFVDALPGEYRVLANYSGQRVHIDVDCRERDAVGLELKVPVSKPSAATAPR